MNNSTQTRISGLSLLIANVLPLCGVLFWGWPLGKLLALYWAESAVIGVFNIFRMWMIDPVRGLPLSVFFAIHFGGFMFVHGMFLTFMFMGHGGGLGPGVLLDMIGTVRWELLALVASHGISFFVHWVIGNEGQGKTLPRQMMAPYGRIIVMHISILFGGFAVTFLGQPEWMLVLFVVLKIVVDLAAHLREHRAR